MIITTRSGSKYKIRRVKEEEYDALKEAYNNEKKYRPEGQLPEIPAEYQAGYFTCIKLNPDSTEIPTNQHNVLLGLSPEISGITIGQSFRIGPGGTSEIQQIQVSEASADQVTPQVQSFTKGFPPQDATVQRETTQMIGRALGTTSTPAPQPTAKARMPQELARILKEIAETNDPSKITTALQEVQNPQETITTLNQYLKAFPLIKPYYSRITKHEIELKINQTQYLLTIEIAYGIYENNSLSCSISITLQPIQERDQQRIAAQKTVQLRQQELKDAENTLTIARANLQQAQEELARLTS